MADRRYGGKVIDNIGRGYVGTQKWGTDKATERYGTSNPPHENAKGQTGNDRFAYSDPNFNRHDTQKSLNANCGKFSNNDVRENSWLRGDDPSRARAGERNPNFIAGYRSPPGRSGYEGARSVEDKSQSGHPLRGEIKNNRAKYQGRKDSGYGEKL